MSTAQVPVTLLEAPAQDVLSPGLTYSAGDTFLWDDNLFKLPSGANIPAELGQGNSRQDHINSAGVSINGLWGYERQSLDLMARVTHNSYSTFNFLDNNSIQAHLYWNWTVGRLTGQLGATEHRELINFAYARLFEKDMVNNYGYFASGRFEINHLWALTASANNSSTDHSLAAYRSSDGRGTSGAFGLEYYILQAMTVELRYKYTDGGYPKTTTIAAATAGGFHDNTTQILLQYEPSDAIQVLGNAGYLRRRYDTGGLQAYSGDIWHMTLKWDPGAVTEVQLAAGRDLISYIDQVNEYFVDDERSITVSWKPREYLGLALVAAWQNEQYIPNTTATASGFQRSDRLNDQKLTFTSSPKSWLTFSASVGLEQRHSNDSSFEFKDKIVSASVKATF